MKVRFALCASSLVLLTSAAASALPPPKTDAEMLALADLVVDAEGITIVCDGKPVVTTQKTTTTYLSTLYPSKSYKGGLPKSFQIRGKKEVWTGGVPPVGGWFQGPVAKGWAGKLYLQKETDGTYTKVWWNAMTEDKALSAPKPLPNCSSATDAGLVVDAGVADAGVVDSHVVADSGAVVDSGVVVDQLATIDHVVATDTTPQPDGATKKDGGTTGPADDGGCAVGSTSDGAPLLPLTLLGLLVLWARRKRR